MGPQLKSLKQATVKLLGEVQEISARVKNVEAVRAVARDGRDGAPGTLGDRGERGPVGVQVTDRSGKVIVSSGELPPTNWFKAAAVVAVIGVVMFVVIRGVVK